MKTKRKRPSYGVSIALAMLFALVAAYKLMVVDSVEYDYDGENYYGS